MTVQSASSDRSSSGSLKRRRYALFACVAVILALVLSTGVVVAGDLYLHHKYADLVGLNIWGYRGPVVASKQPGEWRLEVLGESTAFGYGVRWDESFPAYLENDLKTQTGRRVSVVNLAYNNQGAHSFKFTLDDYKYLHSDAALFYSGYNDLGGANTSIFRDDSLVFRLTGYMPIFPMIFREKAMAMRYGNLEQAYGGGKTTFRPNITARATASALEAAVSITDSLGNQLSKNSVDATVDEAATEGAPCGEWWAHYCGEMYESVKLALSQGKRVLIVTQPYITFKPDVMERHLDQRRHLNEFLHMKFGDDARIRFANLGDAVSVTDPSLCYDGMHLTAKGNERIAAALTSHVRELMR